MSIKREDWVPNKADFTRAVNRFHFQGDASLVDLEMDKMCLKAQVGVLMRVIETLRGKGFNGYQTDLVQKEVNGLREQLAEVIKALEDGPKQSGSFDEGALY